jgi:hypothetical protein
MALVLTKKLPAFDRVAQNTTATLDLPIGYTYHSIALDLSNITPAEIQRITLYANGEAVQVYKSGSDADRINQFDGRSAATSDGVLMLDFRRFGLLTRQGRELTVVGTGRPRGDGAKSGDGMPSDPRPITTLQLEVEIGSTASGSAPGIDARAEITPPQPSGMLKKVQRFVYNPSSSGEFEIADLPRLGTVSRMIFDQSNAAIDRVRIERDQIVTFDRTSMVNERIQGDGIRVPQSNLWVVDFTELGYASDSMNVKNVQDWRTTLYMAGAGAVPVYVEYLAPISNF